MSDEQYMQQDEVQAGIPGQEEQGAGQEEQQAPSEQQQEERLLKQSDVNNIVSRKLAEERTKHERELAELQEKLSSYNKMAEEKTQAPQADPNQPATLADLERYKQQQQQERVYQEAEKHLGRLESEVKQKFTDYEQIKKDKNDIFDLIGADEAMAAAAINTGQPIEFMYHLAKNYPEDVKKIANMGNNMLKFKEMVLLEARLKNGAKLPSKSEAPHPLDDNSSSDYSGDADDVQLVRKRLAGG